MIETVDNLVTIETVIQPAIIDSETQRRNNRAKRRKPSDLLRTTTV